MTEVKVIPLQFDTYLSTIENSVGTLMFKNLFVEINGEKKDATEDGWLSCAFYVSSILVLSKYIKNVHGTVNGTVKDLKENGWKEISEPIVGSVIVWKPGAKTNNHAHIGFYVGDGLAISNDSWKKCPVKYDWKFEGKREVDFILWNESLNIKK